MRWEMTYRHGMGQLRLDPARRAAILDIPRGRRAPRRHPGALRAAAAVLAAAVLLTVGGVALSGQPAVRAWFDRYWQAIAGKPMEEEQSQLLQALTQPIGVSDTVDGVTVTADSAVVGDDSFWLLLTVSGLELSPRYGYTFGSDSLTVTPDPHETGGGIFGWGLESHGVNADGEAELLLQYSYQLKSGANPPWTEDMAVTLRLTDLIQGRSTGADATVAAGTWELNFTLRSGDVATVSLPDTWVECTDGQEGTQRLLLRDITLTATGIRFSSRGEAPRAELVPALVLRDGTEVDCGDGTGAARADGLGMEHNFHWEVPVDLTQVSALCIGDTVIPVEEAEG